MNDLALQAIYEHIIEVLDSSEVELIPSLADGEPNKFDVSYTAAISAKGRTNLGSSVLYVFGGPENFMKEQTESAGSDILHAIQCFIRLGPGSFKGPVVIMSGFEIDTRYDTFFFLTDMLSEMTQVLCRIMPYPFFFLFHPIELFPRSVLEFDHTVEHLVSVDGFQVMSTGGCSHICLGRIFGGKDNIK